MRVLPGIVVAGGVHDLDPGLGQAAKLLQQETLGLEGEAFTVEDIARQQDRMDLLRDGAVDRPAQSLT